MSDNIQHSEIIFVTQKKKQALQSTIWFIVNFVNMEILIKINDI